MKIAILGMGTVGSGVMSVLQTNEELISSQIAHPFEVKYIFAKDVSKAEEKGIDLSSITLTENIDQIIKDDRVEMVIEVLGGVEYPYEIVKACLQAGKHVVSANKDMLALYIDELAEIANSNQVMLAYEASCAGGIPVIQGIETGLNANRLTQVLGILNGTSNFILSKMTNEKQNYSSALKEAQDLGYAESDPTADVQGLDASRKIVLLSRLAYKQKINIEEVEVKGIADIQTKDIEFAKKAGCVLKLLGRSQLNEDSVSINVQPYLVPLSHQLSHVNDAMNAVYVKGNMVGDTMFFGPGAGSEETASAIVADMINIARRHPDSVHNLLPETKAVIRHKETAAVYYIRLAANGEQLASFMSKFHVGSRVLNEEENEWTGLVQGLNSTSLEKLEKEFDVSALYPVEGVVDINV